MKKKSFSLLFKVALISFCSLLSAQEELGSASAEAAHATTSSSNWQAWAFAGSALVTAVVGVVIISTNTGTYNH